MKKKTIKVTQFIDQLHEFIVEHPQFRHKIDHKSEAQIQTEIRPLIIAYLEKYFRKAGYKDYVAKANKSFYWEGQEASYKKVRTMSFATRNYPDFIITAPYNVAIEYKQSSSGSTVKHGIGQSIMHTLCDEFHFVYFLFHDETADKRIQNSVDDSVDDDLEALVVKKMWDDFNVCIRFV